MNEFATFLQMGGHGLYVWLAYGIAWAVLIVLATRPILSRRRFVAMHAADRERGGELHGRRAEPGHGRSGKRRLRGTGE